MDFDNIFDTALNDADDRIIETMGIFISFAPGGREPIRGVFDNPDEGANNAQGGTVKLKTGGRIQSTKPTLFVRTSSIPGLKEKDELVIKGDSYWVEKIGPDDNGSCTLTLGHGKPGQIAPPGPSPKKWS